MLLLFSDLDHILVVHVDHQCLGNHQYRVRLACGSSPKLPCSPCLAQYLSGPRTPLVTLCSSCTQQWESALGAESHQGTSEAELCDRHTGVAGAPLGPQDRCKHRHFSLPIAQARHSVPSPPTQPNTWPCPARLPIRKPPVSQGKPGMGPCRLPSAGGLPGPVRRERAHSACATETGRQSSWKRLLESSNSTCGPTLPCQPDHGTEWHI